METIAKVRPATVAIVGRPNVGKSALFNRLVGKRLAIVDDEPGVTRDRLYALVEWRNRTFSVIDTAGIDPDAISSDEMARQTRAQAEIAANDADVIVFVVDGKAGLSPLDDDVVHIMRKTRRPVVLCANKAESDRVKLQIPGEFARLGFGEPILVSALHGEGTGDLLDAIVEKLPDDILETIDDTELALAIVGRPRYPERRVTPSIRFSSFTSTRSGSSIRRACGVKPNITARSNTTPLYDRCKRSRAAISRSS